MFTEFFKLKKENRNMKRKPTLGVMSGLVSTALVLCEVLCKIINTCIVVS